MGELFINQKDICIVDEASLLVPKGLLQEPNYEQKLQDLLNDSEKNANKHFQVGDAIIVCRGVGSVCREFETLDKLIAPAVHTINNESSDVLKIRTAMAQIRELDESLVVAQHEAASALDDFCSKLEKLIDRVKSETGQLTRPTKGVVRNLAGDIVLEKENAVPSLQEFILVPAGKELNEYSVTETIEKLVRRHIIADALRAERELWPAFRKALPKEPLHPFVQAGSEDVLPIFEGVCNWSWDVISRDRSVWSISKLPEDGSAPGSCRGMLKIFCRKVFAEHVLDFSVSDGDREALIYAARGGPVHGGKEALWCHRLGVDHICEYMIIAPTDRIRNDGFGEGFHGHRLDTAGGGFLGPGMFAGGGQYDLPPGYTCANLANSGIKVGNFVDEATADRFDKLMKIIPYGKCNNARQDERHVFHAGHIVEVLNNLLRPADCKSAVSEAAVASLWPRVDEFRIVADVADEDADHPLFFPTGNTLDYSRKTYSYPLVSVGSGSDGGDQIEELNKADARSAAGGGATDAEAAHRVGAEDEASEAVVEKSSSEAEGRNPKVNDGEATMGHAGMPSGGDDRGGANNSADTINTVADGERASGEATSAIVAPVPPLVFEFTVIVP